MCSPGTKQVKDKEGNVKMKKFEMLNIICSNNSELTAKEKLVAHYFVYKSNRSGACYPAVQTIAEQCGVSRRTIQRATKKLQERGYINIEKRYNMGKQTSNLYAFNILLLEEIKREKETVREEEEQQEEKVSGDMESIEFDELFQKEDNQVSVEQEIDLDEMAAMSVEETQEEWMEADAVPFEETEKSEIHSSQIRQQKPTQGHSHAEEIKNTSVKVFVPVSQVKHFLQYRTRIVHFIRKSFRSCHRRRQRKLYPADRQTAIEASIMVMGAFFPP